MSLVTVADNQQALLDSFCEYENYAAFKGYVTHEILVDAELHCTTADGIPYDVWFRDSDQTRTGLLREIAMFCMAYPDIYKVELHTAFLHVYYGIDQE